MTLLLASLLVELLPGDAALVVAGVDAPPAEVARISAALRTDAPPISRILASFGDLVSGRGASLVQGAPVRQIIAPAMARTLALAGTALLISIAIAVGVGVAAVGCGGVRAVARLFEYLALATPQFWLGLFALYLFAYRLRLIPFFAGEGAGTFLLAATVLAVGNGAFLSRTIGDALRELDDAPLAHLLRSLGYSRRRVVWAHLLPIAIYPAVSLITIQIGYLISGAIVVESVFSLPGVGRVMLAAVEARDIPVIQGLVVRFGVLVPVLAIAGDALGALLWPPARRSR